MQAGGKLKGAQRVGGAAHVIFHAGHGRARLETVTAAVKGDAFADQSGKRGVAIALIGDADEARRDVGTAAYSLQGIGADFCGRKNLDGQSELPRGPLTFCCQHVRTHQIGWRIA